MPNYISWTLRSTELIYNVNRSCSCVKVSQILSDGPLSGMTPVSLYFVLISVVDRNSNSHLSKSPNNGGHSRYFEPYYSVADLGLKSNP